MFNLTSVAIERSQNFFIESEKNDKLPSLCEGADVFDVLCPVSKKTGHRENPLSLLVKVLPPDKERLAAMILQEIPSIQQENPRISDADAIEMCVSRFSSGSKYEDQQVRQALLDAADLLFPDASDAEKAAAASAVASESPDVETENV